MRLPSSARRTFAAVLPPLLLLLLALVAVGGEGCGGGPAATRPYRPHDGPIVFITFGSLRADVVGGLGGVAGLTPRLDALIRQADWSGRAIAASSRGGPALASLWTGLRPWQHQVLHSASHLSPDLLTLAEALKAASYPTAGFPGGPGYAEAQGFAQGFDAYDPNDRGRGAAESLRRLGDGRRFVWIHIPEPGAPYVLRRRLLPRVAKLGLLPPELPARIRPMQLEPFFDPGVPLPEGKRRRFWAMYLLNVAWADDKLGRLIDALRASGEWDRTLLVVTADQGEEFGEHGQIGHGGNLGRQLVEVPLVVKLPAGFGRPLRVPRGERVAATRLWATLVEAAGGPVPPAAAPSLFRPIAWPALSELYLTNGTNQLSLVEGDWQLLWDSRFAPPEPAYYQARLQALGGPAPPPGSAARNEEPAAVFGRLQSAFAAAPPLYGLETPRLTLEHWETKGGSRAVADPRREAEMARRLAAAWSTFVPDELTPAGEARERDARERGGGRSGQTEASGLGGLPF